MRGLALSGGGIRGYIEACFLDLLVSKDFISDNLNDSFQVMGGTSTGGLQVLGYGMGKSPRTLRTLFETQGHVIFSGKKGKRLTPLEKSMAFLSGEPFYNHDKLKGVVATVLGDQMLQNLPHPNIFVTTYLREGHFLQLDATTSDMSLVDAACATSATPFYFGGYKTSGKTYDDGFIYCNNPSLLVMKRILAQSFTFSLLSMGTGTHAVEAYAPDRIHTGEELVESHYASQVRLMTHMIQGQNILVQETCSTLCDAGKFLHLDISLEDIGDAGMDNADADFLLALERKCREAFDEKTPEIKAFFS